MANEKLKVLRVMSEVTHKMDLNEFARMAGMEVNEALQCIQDLTKAGFLKKSGGGYGITEKGKNVLKAQTPVPDACEFRFHMAVGQSTGLSAKSLKEFYETVKTIGAASLEFHLYRRDFENWVQAVLKDEVFAGELEKVRHGELKGESLRKRLVAVIETRYTAEALR